MTSPRPLASALWLLMVFSTSGLRAQAAEPLVTNTGYEIDADGNGWPDGWAGVNTGGSWEQEEGNHFLRLASPEPGKMVMQYQEIRIPDGAEALEVSWRQRVTGLKVGAKSWFDARIMFGFMNVGRVEVKPDPAAVATSRDTAGWVERRTSFLVPEGATVLKFMPSLFNVAAGTFDLDDMVITVADPQPLREAAAARNAKREAESAKRQADAAKLFQEKGNLVTWGDYSSATGDKITEEEGNRFLRLTATTPPKMVMDYKKVVIPPDAKAIEMTWRQRVTDLKVGEKPWFDARIILEWQDSSGKKMKEQPPASYRQSNSKGWEDKRSAFLVPDGAVTLVMMPTLFSAKAGVYDLDDFVLRPVDPAPLVALREEREARAAKARVPREEPAPARWPKAIRVVGNKILDADGREVWLQGLNVPSLEWSVAGEQVLKSVVVAVDEWKGNVVRIPVKDDYWFGKNPVQSDGGKGYRDLVDQMITLASNRGAYVILDLHRYRAPRPEYLDFWKDAASRYKNHPALIFDLMNEPHDTSWEVWRNGGFVGDKKTMDQAAFLTVEERAKAKGFDSPGMQAMLDAVRSTGARNVVLVGGLDYAYQLDGILDGFALEDKTGDGIIYASHVYPWKRGWQKHFLDAAARYPVLFGEVGADAKKMDFMPHDIQEDANTWAPAILGLIQKHRIHWTGWCFHPGATPRMILDWDYTPTPFWGQLAKDALGGKTFPPPDSYR